MATQLIRAVVIGSSWRHMHTVSMIDPVTGKHGPPDPDQDMFVAQFAPIEPLVRRALLYFDRLVWPTNNVVSQGELLDGEYLQSCGLLRILPLQFEANEETRSFLKMAAKTGIGLSGKITAFFRQLSQLHVEAFKELEKVDPGIWSFATIGEGLDAPTDATIEKRSVRMDLHACLPIPTQPVPYQETIDFKTKRAAELQALRVHLEEVYLRIVNNADVPASKTLEMVKVEQDLANVQRLLTERRIPFTLESRGVDLSVPGLVKAGAVAHMAGAAGTHIGMPYEVSAPLAGAAALFRFTLKRTVSPVQRAGAYKYIYHAGREEMI